MSYKKWGDLKSKIFFALTAFFLILLLSWITREDDPDRIIYNGFWFIVGVAGSISIIAWIYVTLKEIFKKK